MRTAADIVIVGGGIFGCAVAWNLARLGARHVILIERGEIGTASTSRAAGLLTRVRTKAGQTALAQQTRQAIAELEEELGESVGVRKVGSLHVAASEGRSAGLEDLRRVAETCKEPFATIDRAEAEQRVPWLDAGDAMDLLMMPDEAFVDPYLLASFFARAARQRGVEVRTAETVIGLVREGQRVLGVRTEKETIHAGCTIDAAGPWSGLLSFEAGYHLPITPIRSHYWITEPRPIFPDDHPCVILPDARAYTRPEVGGLLFGLRDRTSASCDPRSLPEDLGSLRFGDEPHGHEALTESGPLLENFFPGLSDIGIAHYIAGPSTYTPDGQFVLGRLPGVDGRVVCSGCCGAGIAVSGGVGLAIAELAHTGETSFDLEACRPDRFGGIDAFGVEWQRRCAAARSEKTSG